MEEGGVFELFHGPSRCDVLRAVPVEGGEVEDDGAFGAPAIIDLELVLPLGGFGDLVPRDGLDGGEDLEARLIRVVHEEESGAGVGAQVAGGGVVTFVGCVGVGGSA